MVAKLWCVNFVQSFFLEHPVEIKLLKLTWLGELSGWAESFTPLHRSDNHSGTLTSVPADSWFLSGAVKVLSAAFMTDVWSA